MDLLSWVVRRLGIEAKVWQGRTQARVSLRVIARSIPQRRLKYGALERRVFERTLLRRVATLNSLHYAEASTDDPPFVRAALIPCQRDCRNLWGAAPTVDEHAAETM